ncbi:MAG: hypothetical protein WC906_00960 [Parcubacteria group bacterium]|jgi:hypothetical protein
MDFEIRKYWRIIAIAAGIALVFAIIAFAINLRNRKVNLSKNILEETGKIKESKSADWWLNSGGIMDVGDNDNIFSTNIGNLPKNSKWQKLYAKNNPTDTDGGYKPQNIFRLVNRNKYQDFSQSFYFYINKINLSDSKNRNESNGILLFNRYQDGDNLYYAGLRVDGYFVVKKKIDEKYYTMDEKSFLTSGKKYSRNSNANFIPVKTWIGIKSEVKNTDDETVEIKLYVDWEQKGDWQLVLETTDSGDAYGDNPFLDEGYAGIRTDFMDVEFKNYNAQEL